MFIEADMHIHTVASTHAYSTVFENAVSAKKAGLKAIAITDHGPAIQDGAHIYHFFNMDIIDRYIDGVLVFKGAEANIINQKGGVDIPENILKKLEFVIASFHASSYDGKGEKDVTTAIEGMLENPYIDCFGHPGNENYPFDMEKIIPLFKKYNKLIEINANSFNLRKSSIENCRKIAGLCKKHGVQVCVNSDAHYHTRVGELEKPLNILDELDMPESLIINSSLEGIKDFIEKKRGVSF